MDGVDGVRRFGKFSVISKSVGIGLGVSEFSDRCRRTRCLLSEVIVSDVVPFVPVVAKSFVGQAEIRDASLRKANGMYTTTTPCKHFLCRKGKVISRTAKDPCTEHKTGGILIDRFSNRATTGRGLRCAGRVRPRTRTG